MTSTETIYLRFWYVQCHNFADFHVISTFNFCVIFANSWSIGSMKMKTMIRSSLHQMAISRLQLNMQDQLVGRSAALYISSLFFSLKHYRSTIYSGAQELCEPCSLIDGNPLSLSLYLNHRSTIYSWHLFVEHTL